MKVSIILLLCVVGCAASPNDSMQKSAQTATPELSNPVNSPLYIFQLREELRKHDRLRNEEYLRHVTG